MEYSYSHKIMPSQAYNQFRIIESVPMQGCGAQVSYNIPKEMFDELKERNVIVLDNSVETRVNGSLYYLREDINFVLSDAIIGIIGEKYRNLDNKFVIQHASSNNKPQLIRSLYSSLGMNYEWFVELYNNNCINSVMTYTYNDVTKEFVVDVSYQPETVTITEESQSEIKVKEKNVILYGVPGCGKSFTIKRDYCNDEKYMERVVFHPDYTYSDFVGQILPIIDGEKISYQFVPGPFTRVLKKAHDDQENQYYLIIEEINRGNASAIFGDIFQLLDRKDGESEYSIDNQDIAKVVYENPNDEDNSWKEATGKDFEEHPIKIPSNVSILATMNTADQNVFTLDTAFKRRWKLESIPNTFDDCAYSTAEIADTGVSWQSFVETINSEIIDFNKEGIVSEDKRIGAFFLSENEIANSKLFAEKVLLYLWEDAFKYHREIFANEYQTLEDLIKGFEENKFKVFIDEINSKFEANTTTLKVAPGVEEYVQYSKRLKSQEIFREVFDKLKDEIPSLIANTVSTKQYIRLKAENTAHANLAEVKFLADDRVKFDVEFVEEYEEKLNQQEGNCNHKYFYICDASSVDIAVEILNKSYITTKKEK